MNISQRQSVANEIEERLAHRLTYNEKTKDVELDGKVVDFRFIVPFLYDEFGIETKKTIAKEEILYLAHKNAYYPPLQKNEENWLRLVSKAKSKFSTGIHPSCIKKFQQESEKYQILKDRVEAWISEYCSPSTEFKSVYSLKHRFQSEIGCVTHGCLTFWLADWGFPMVHRERPYNAGLYNHDVYLKLKRRHWKDYEIAKKYATPVYIN